ncbi:MAG: lamin tail domain-containing protein, partial [bacterium]|nr:lamin tail domain-containing protein [bacterium]
MKCTRLVCLMAALLVASTAWAGLYDAPYEMRFSTWTTNLENWTNYGTGNYTTGWLVGNSVSFNDLGDSLESPTLDNPDTMKVGLKANGTSTAGVFKIYVKQGTNAYTLLRNCTWGTGQDIQNATWRDLVIPLATGYRCQDDVKFKFVFEVKISGTNVAMDSFRVAACSGADVTPPSISSITETDNTHLDVLFSEAVDQTTAETEGNYVVTPGSTSPSLATRDGGNIALVHLTFGSALPAGLDTLTVNGVEDLSDNACTSATGYFQLVEAGDIRINEVMYDDTASADTEWVEIHNTTGNVISVAGWYLTDDDSYPALSGEGGLTVPAGTTIPANGYLVLCKTALADITGEIVCTPSGSFALANTGDNLALYTAATGGTLVDGSLTVFYPDLSTPGYSIEKCNEHAAWDGSASAWHMSSNAFGTARYLSCTPGAANTVCVDLTPPGIASLTVIGDTQLDVLFDEPVEQITAETEANYVVTPGGATPTSAVRDGNIFLVHLTFALAFPPGTDMLTVNAVQDTSSNHNACVDEWATFLSGGDLTPPGIVSVTPLSRTALDVLFTEPVDLTTAETEANYTVIPGNANPNSALRDATNLALVHLTFASNLPAGLDTLNVNAVQDTSSNHNACVNVQETFNIPLVNEGDVVINEIMYDDAGTPTDSEWVELYNRTTSAIDISGWVVLDAAMYPVTGGEGGFYLPAGTSIPAHGYLVVSKVPLLGIDGEVVGTQYHSSWALTNTGDNVGLYTDTTGGLRIDGWATANTLLFYPDWAGSNAGASLEKCVEDSPWPADSTGWHVSTNVYSATGKYLLCTPGATNSPCVGDTVRPTLVSATAQTYTILDVVFSEPVEETTAETVTNYSVNNGVGNPATATLQGNQITVRLVFANPLPLGTDTLTVNNVTDLASNAILPNSKIAFTVTAGSYNVVITEIMPDPAAVADNSGEWFEIYNGGASAVDMTGWTVTDGEGTFTITAATINAGDYFVFACNGDSATNGGVPEDY